jgi:hypothetical protein
MTIQILASWAGEVAKEDAGQSRGPLGMQERCAAWLVRLGSIGCNSRHPLLGLPPTWSKLNNSVLERKETWEIPANCCSRLRAEWIDSGS